VGGASFVSDLTRSGSWTNWKLGLCEESLWRAREMLRDQE
jgi:hypothetical protein